MSTDLIVIDEADNVGVTMRDIPAGEAVAPEPGEHLTVLEEVPAGHKIAIRDIARGTAVLKYGESIGVAAEDIPRGAWVHTHNMKPVE